MSAIGKKKKKDKKAAIIDAKQYIRISFKKLTVSSHTNSLVILEPDVESCAIAKGSWGRRLALGTV
jgi:hypothetical protein